MSKLAMDLSAVDHTEEVHAPEQGHPPLLHRLSDDERRQLLAICTRRQLLPGESLFVQGDPFVELFIVQSGRLRVHYASENGSQLTFAYWTAGTLVGMPAIDGQFTHLWTADAVEVTDLLVAPRRPFRALMSGMPSLAIGVIEALEFKAMRLGNLSQILATSSVARRLQLLLLNLIALYGRRKGNEIVLSVPFTHEEISGMVSASRPWVSSMLSQLKYSELLAYSGRLMAFPDVDRLRLVDFEELTRGGQRHFSPGAVMHKTAP